MTQDSILEKLQHELQLDLTTECQVVYILAEIRKAIEQADELDGYRALDFYCSFALHTRMGKVGAKRILERFDKAYPIWIARQQLPQELRQEIGQTAKLDRFRREMKTFLKANNLPTRLFTDPDAWAKFVHLYGKIIDECELVLRGDSGQLQFIDRVVVHLKEVSKPLATEFGNQMLISICWTCHGKDGKSVDFDVFFGFDQPAADPKKTC
jgi:hypothetical protein